MTEVNQAAAAPAQPPRRWPALLLLIAAIIEFLGGLGALPILAGDLSEVPGPGLDGAIIIAGVVLQPLLAFAALYFIIRGKIPYALLAMAFIILMSWLSFVPSIRLHGLDLQSNLLDVTLGSAMVTGGLFFQVIIAPMIALTIAGLVLTGKHITLATLLAVLPTLIQVLGVVAFGISVAIYGF
jgi:hypothetical protein